MKTTLHSDQHFLSLAVDASTDELVLRKTIQDALARAFGLAAAATAVDVLALSAPAAADAASPTAGARDRRQAIVRVAAAEYRNVIAALALLPGQTHVVLVDHSAFLPALL